MQFKKTYYATAAATSVKVSIEYGPVGKGFFFLLNKRNEIKL